MWFAHTLFSFVYNADASGFAVGLAALGLFLLDLVLRAQIGPRPQSRLVGILIDDEVGAVVDHLIHDFGGRPIYHDLVAEIDVGARVRTVRLNVRRRDHGLVGIELRRNGRFRGLRYLLHASRRHDRCPHRPDAKTRAHGSLLASCESKCFIYEALWNRKSESRARAGVAI